ncbi:MAG: MATE family efflux transporter [Bacteroidales bacterium]|nr:MATE family efflux transporter [Bacteroidales bacterium]
MKDLTTGNEAKLIAKFAAPMLLGSFFQQFYHFVDRIIVGNLIGKEALTGIGESFPLIYALISFSIGISTGGTIVISQYYGAKNYDKVKKAIDTLYIFMFSVSIVISVAGIAFSEHIFRLIDLPEDVLPQALVYFNTSMAGTIMFFGFNGTSAILRGLGDSKTPLYFLAISTVMNVICDYVFIKYFGWGVRGAALATIFAQGGAFITAVVYLNRTHKLVKLYIHKLAFDKQIFIQSFRIGMPSGFQQTFVALGMLAILKIVNQFGTDVATAYTIAVSIDGLAMLPAMNFGQALSTFVGQNIGGKKNITGVFWIACHFNTIVYNEYCGNGANINI